MAISMWTYLSGVWKKPEPFTKHTFPLVAKILKRRSIMTRNIKPGDVILALVESRPGEYEREFVKVLRVSKGRIKVEDRDGVKVNIDGKDVIREATQTDKLHWLD